jgi:type IV secretory pathway TrbL component
MAPGEPAWAARMRRRQTTAHGASATSHALRSGDSPSAGSSVDLSEE